MHSIKRSAPPAGPDGARSFDDAAGDGPRTLAQARAQVKRADQHLLAALHVRR
jgi:hypothetical protein